MLHFNLVLVFDCCKTYRKHKTTYAYDLRASRGPKSGPSIVGFYAQELMRLTSGCWPQLDLVSSRFIQVVHGSQSLTVIGLGFLFSCWLLGEGLTLTRSQVVLLLRSLMCVRKD